jgi:hypothetical protein
MVLSRVRRELHNEKFHGFYSTQNVCGVGLSRKMEGRGMKHTQTNFYTQYLKGRRPLGRPKYSWKDRYIVKMGILNKPFARGWTEFKWPGVESRGKSFENGNKHSDSVKGGIFLDQLSDFWLFKKNSEIWSSLFAVNSRPMFFTTHAQHLHQGYNIAMS